MEKFKVGEAPWEKEQTSFKVGQAPWEIEETQDEAESAIRGASQGLSAGFYDELSGLTEAAGTALGLKGAGGPIKDIELSEQGPTIDLEVLKNAYQTARDLEREKLEKGRKDNPAITASTQVIGSIASPLSKVLPGGALAKNVAFGGIDALGQSNADNVADLALDAEKGVLTSLVLGKAAPLVAKGIKSTPAFLRKEAGKFAENATGATAVQAEKFAEGAGNELLDRGLIKAGDTAENIAKRTRVEMNKANTIIDQSLKKLDEGGATVSVDKVIERLQKKVSELKRDASQAGLVKKINSVIEDIVNTGEKEIPLSLAEQTKRGFRKASGNWMDPQAGQAGKQAYLGYMDEVEKAAMDANPQLAGAFEEGKKTYGLLAPIQEAAERRAMQLNQSPMGGLGDIASVAAGGGGPAGVLTAAGRRTIAPRISSTMAVGTNLLSKGAGMIADPLASTVPYMVRPISGQLNQFINYSNSIGMPPQQQEAMIKRDKSIPNTEKAKARNQIRGG